MNTLLLASNQMAGIRQQKEPFKITEKLIKTTDQRLKKNDYNFYYVIDEKLTRSQHEKAQKFLSGVFLDKHYILANEESLSYDEKEQYFIIDNEEIINGEDFKDILKSEIGLK